MWSIGGQYFEEECLAGGVINIFNLNNLEWVSTYDPAVWAPYVLPDMIADTIKLTATKWDDPAPAQIFSTRYEKSITVFYPYGSGSSTADKVENVLKQTFASWFAGIIGISLYLLLSTVCITVIVLVRRWALLRRCGAEPLTSVEARRSYFVRWMNNMKVETEEKEGLMENEHEREREREEGSKGQVSATEMMVENSARSGHC